LRDIARLPARLAAFSFLILVAWLPLAVHAAERARELTIETTSGPHRFSVEWATTDAERERGLMFRKSMAADHGMMFDFGDEEPVAFWMKNTPLSLDMLFIADDGTVKRIAHRAKPYSLDVIPSGAAVRYVFEIVGGTADKLGIAPGAKVVFGTPH